MSTVQSPFKWLGGTGLTLACLFWPHALLGADLARSKEISISPSLSLVKTVESFPLQRSLLSAPTMA